MFLLMFNLCSGIAYSLFLWTRTQAPTRSGTTWVGQVFTGEQGKETRPTGGMCPLRAGASKGRSGTQTRVAPSFLGRDPRSLGEAAIDFLSELSRFSDVRLWGTSQPEAFHWPFSS